MDEARYQAALDLEAAGKREEAVAELRGLIDASADPAADGLAFAALADNLRQLGRALEARGYIAWAYSVLEKTDVAYPYAVYIDALIDEDLDQHKLAVSKLEILLNRHSRLLANPEHQRLRNDVLLKQGLNLAHLDKNAEARPLLEAALRLGLGGDSTLFHLGICCFDLGDYAAAEGYLKQVLALALEPSRVARAHYTLSIICYRQRRYAWARQELEWCLENGGDYLPEGAILKAILASSRAMGLDEDPRRFSRPLHNP